LTGRKHGGLSGIPAADLAPARALAYTEARDVS